MIKLSNILQEYKKESRSKIIVNKKFNSLLTKFYGNKKDAIQANAPSIYRRIDNYGDNYIFIQPSKHIRKSANTANYYTLIIDNSKYWKEYPKRSKSIICTTRNARAYDYLYQVYPRIGAKIGICPEGDMWVSFTKGLKLINKMFGKTLGALDEFNSFLKTRFKIKKSNSYLEIKKKINKYVLDEAQKEMLNAYNCNTLFDFIEYCLSPDLNGFQLVAFDENFKARSGTKELWTDADSLLENIKK